MMCLILTETREGVPEHEQGYVIGFPYLKGLRRFRKNKRFHAQARKYR